MLEHQEVLADGPLTIAWDRFGQDVSVVSLAGELDLSNVGSADEVIARLRTDAPDEILVVDLSSLEFIDSAGIKLLMSLTTTDAEGRHLRIVPSEAPAVSRIMRLTGLEKKVQIARERPARAA